MSRIRASATAPELRVLAVLRALGQRPRCNDRTLPGRPDLVLRGRRMALFVHGCFWHRHRGCPRTYTPATSQRFWAEKFLTNVRRDRRVVAALRRDGWSVATVWECQTAGPRLARLRRRLGCLLAPSGG